ncbi:hypothetical protein PL1_1376 [Paenibacillus larvae subsp. larvae B-3650]|nr:hypothetical protein BXP28_04480 [Paenibacillus larvae subsp. larvae]PCK72322.1 hypothetical protein PL1_1376 [Paenibacillus larvae subsp. larvae B-3650]
MGVNGYTFFITLIRYSLSNKNRLFIPNFESIAFKKLKRAQKLWWNGVSKNNITQRKVQLLGRVYHSPHKIKTNFRCKIQLIIDEDWVIKGITLIYKATSWKNLRLIRHSRKVILNLAEDFENRYVWK